MFETIYQDGKVFKDIDFQIMVRKEQIRNLELSITKSYKLATANGPKGISGVDYTRVISTTPIAHIGLDDVIITVEKNKKKIRILEEEIKILKNRKRNLIKTLKSLDGVNEQIFFHRVIMCETQETAADEIGLSTRQLQRIEKQMKDTAIIFDFS